LQALAALTVLHAAARGIATESLSTRLVGAGGHRAREDDDRFLVSEE
jgi:hypothetical protein